MRTGIEESCASQKQPMTGLSGPNVGLQQSCSNLCGRSASLEHSPSRSPRSKISTSDCRLQASGGGTSASTGQRRVFEGHAPMSDGGVSLSDCRDRMFEIDWWMRLMPTFRYRSGPRCRSADAGRVSRRHSRSIGVPISLTVQERHRTDLPARPSIAGALGARAALGQRISVFVDLGIDRGQGRLNLAHADPVEHQRSRHHSQQDT